MELIIHIGTNKTGSSALQSHMAINRSVLRKMGFWFVESAADKKMELGQISAGNGIKLAKYLHNEDESSLLHYLDDLKRTAQNNDINSIILSNEVIIRLFSNKNILIILDRVCSKLQFEKVKCISVIRNPLDHALSLYKHRAKGGSWENIEEWFEQNYETLNLFKKFIKHYKEFRFEWLFLEYKSSNLFLEDFYSKGLNTPLTNEYKGLSKKVNRSLHLNTIKIVQLLTHRFPFLGNVFYSDLIHNKYNKKENPDLVFNFNSVASNYFNRNIIVFNEIVDLVGNSKWKAAVKSFSEESKKVNFKNEIILSDEHQLYLINIMRDINYFIRKDKIMKIKLLLKRNLFYKKRNVKFNTSKYGGNIKF